MKRFLLGLTCLFSLMLSSAQGTEQRIGVFVGIDRYCHKEYSRLGVAVRDVKAVAKRMEPTLDTIIELHDEKATCRAIEQLFLNDLPEISQPGDTIFVVWSGHGDRCPDENGDEEDGYDEFLCPHDVRRGNPETYILDDKLLTWVRRLDDRQFVFILDTCYSGGMTKAEPPTFDFFGDETTGAGPDGPMKHVVFASSAGGEKSHVHGSRKYSVFTFYLLEFLDLENDGDLKEAYRYVTPRIIHHLREYHKNRNNGGAALFYPVSRKICLKARSPTGNRQSQ